MKIKSVTIQGFHNVDKKTYELKDINYLFGSNGAGKSTVLQAIQLALLGYIPGTNKTNAAIFSHANSNIMSVVLVLDNEPQITISRTYIKSGTSANCMVSIEPDGYDANYIKSLTSEIELPIFNFTEFVGMTANTLKDWFINFLPKNETTINWKVEFENTLKQNGKMLSDHTLIDDTVSQINGFGLSGMDEVRKANDYLKNLQSFKKSELNRLQDTIQSLVHYDDVSSTQTIEELDAAIADYSKKQKAQMDIKTKISNAMWQNNRIDEQLAAFKDFGEHFETDPKYVKAAELIETLPIEIDTQDTIYNEGMAEYKRVSNMKSECEADIRSKQAVLKSDGTCPYTNRNCASISVLQDQYKKEVMDLENQLAELTKNCDDILTNAHEALAVKNDLTKQLSEANADIAHIKSDYQTRDLLKDDYVMVPELVDNTNYDALITELTDTRAKVFANAKYAQMMDSLIANKYKVEQELDAIKLWVNLTGVNGLQTSNGGTDAFAELITKMNDVLGVFFTDDTKAHFLLANKANSFSFGIMRNGNYIQYDLLSSGEKCLFTLALMICLTRVSKSPLKIIMVDDLFDHLDDVNITKLFDALSEVSDIQMIFAGVKNVSNGTKYIIKI